MKIIVCGSRTYDDKPRLFSVLDAMHAETLITDVIHGAAPGADSLAHEWAFQRDVRMRPYHADWGDLTTEPLAIRHGRNGPYNAAAGGIRNQKMLDEGQPDRVVAFPGGPGTKDMVTRARRAGVTVIEITTTWPSGKAGGCNPSQAGPIPAVVSNSLP